MPTPHDCINMEIKDMAGKAVVFFLMVLLVCTSQLQAVDIFPTPDPHPVIHPEEEKEYYPDPGKKGQGDFYFLPIYDPCEICHDLTSYEANKDFCRDCLRMLEEWNIRGNEPQYEYKISHYQFAKDWNKQDTMLEILFTTLILIDRQQTMEVTKHPDELYENNPFLGENPSVGEVNRAFIFVGILHPLTSAILPPPYRGYWQFFTIGVEGHAVYMNFKKEIW